MTVANTISRHRYLSQIVAVAVTSSAFSLLAAYASVRSPSNLLWGLGLPLLLALGANPDWGRRLLMVIILLGVSLVAMTLVWGKITNY
jgi:hypothetical protein